MMPDFDEMFGFDDWATDCFHLGFDPTDQGSLGWRFDDFAAESSFEAESPPSPVTPPPTPCHRRANSDPLPLPFASLPRAPQPTHPGSFPRARPLCTDPSNDAEFARLCHDPSVKFDAVKLGLLPLNVSATQEITFGALAYGFFQKKNTLAVRFPHKLFNALKLVESDPFYADFVGVEWVNETVLKVNKRVFARLLGIKTIDGSLFHQQGNFRSHGFAELGVHEARACLSEADLADVDFDEVRLLVHQTGAFTRSSRGDQVEHCKWTNNRRRD
jgi:hypothetical protein